jgi:H+/Cl- antiporter ClcA
MAGVHWVAWVLCSLTAEVAAGLFNPQLVKRVAVGVRRLALWALVFRAAMVDPLLVLVGVAAVAAQADRLQLLAL